LRTAHLGVQGIFLALGVAAMLVFSGLYNVYPLHLTRQHIGFGESALALLAEPEPADERLRALLLEHNADGRLAERLDARLQADRDSFALRFQGANLAERVLHRMAVNADDSDEQLHRELRFQIAASRADPPTQSSGRPREQDFDYLLSEYAGPALALLALFPGAWVVWAFLTRGGLTLRIMGLALVRADGRPAARWQCAWRALLVWLPVLLPLVACVWIKVFAPGLRFVHTGFWWLAVAALLAEVVLGILRPHRALHDRLAGTYLVPL
jgi:hypothetical protein